MLRPDGDRAAFRGLTKGSGRRGAAIVSYLTVDFTPTNADTAALVKVIFEDDGFNLVAHATL
jgi:hypothetical protein